MAVATQIRCPDISQVRHIVDEVKELIHIFSNMSSLENSLFDNCVDSYLELQNYPGEKILDPTSFYVAQFSLLRYVMSIHSNMHLFSELVEYSDYIYSFIESVEFLDKYCDEKKWMKLSVAKKKKIVQTLDDMDILLNQHPLGVWQKKQNSFKASVRQILNSSNIWKQFSKNPGVYRQTLEHILRDMGLEYSPVSSVPDTEKKINFSNISQVKEIMHNRSWRLMPRTYLLKAIDDTLLDYKTTIIPPQSNFLDFFHASSLKPGEKIDITLYAGNAVFPGIIFRDYDYGYLSYLPVKLHIDNHFSLDLTGIEYVPKGREASLVFIPRRTPTCYTISVMLLPQDSSHPPVPVEDIGKQDYWMDPEYNRMAKFQNQNSPLVSLLTRGQIRNFTEMSEYSDDFIPNSSDLLYGGVSREWGYVPRNVVIYSLSSGKNISGTLEIPAWILPIFINKKIKGDTRMLLSAIYAGKNYVMLLDYHHKTQSGTLILPDGLVRLVHDVRKPLVEKNLYLLISFENVDQDVFVVHFGSSNEGLTAIRNHNPPQLLKRYPNRIERDAVIRSRDGIDDAPNTNVFEINSLNDVEALLLEDYETNSKLILAAAKKQFPMSVYQSFETYIKLIGNRLGKENDTSGSEKKKTAVQKQITLDWNQVQAASDDLNTTAELLGVAYDDVDAGPSASSMVEKFEESVSGPVVALSDGDEEWQSFADALSPQQSAFVRAMLTGTGKIADLKRLAKQEGKLLDTYFDELNELAVDTFGDVLIDDGEIISEYRDVLSRILRISS